MGQVIKGIEQLSLLIAIFAVSVIMVVVSADAIMRYAFNAPMQWVTEVVRYYLMVVGIYFALSATFTHGDHVNITLLRDYIPVRVRAWIDVVWCLIAALVFALIAYATWGNVTHGLRTTEVIPGYVLWPSWLSHLAIPLGAALIVLRLVRHSFLLAVHGRDREVAEEGDVAE